MKPRVEKNQPSYISNPLKLAFEASKRFFSTNKGWAILLLILGFFSGASQFGRFEKPAPTTSSSASITQTDTTSLIAMIIFVGVFVLIFLSIMTVTAIFVQGILTHIALESEKGKKATLPEAFNATSKRFWRLLGAQLLAFAKITGWSLLFIIPGIIAALRYTLLAYIIMDEPAEQKGIKAAHDRAKAIVKSRLLEVLGISIVGGLPVVGGLFDLTGKAALYRQLAVYHDKNIQKPKMHWLNIVAPILALLAALVMVLFFILYIR